MSVNIEFIDATMNAPAGSTSLLLNGTSVTGAGNGDVLIIGLGFHDHTVTNVAIGNSKGTWTQLATEVATGDHLLQVWRCIITNAAGANPSVTWTTTSKLETICYRLGGVHQTTPMDVNESEANGNSSTISVGSITVASQRVLLIMFASQGGSGAVGKFSSWSSPLTEDVENGDGANITIASASGDATGPGATGAKSATSVQSQPWAAVLCAVRPAPETFNQAATVTNTPSVATPIKSVGKITSIQRATSLVIAKAVTTATTVFSIARASSVSVTAQPGINRLVERASAVTMVRSIGLVRLIEQAPALTYIRDLAITLSVSAGHAIAIARSRLITIAAQSSTVVLPVLFGFGKVVTVLQGAVVALQRAISKIIPVEQTPSATAAFDRNISIPIVQQAVQVTNEVTDARLFQVGTDVAYAEGQPGVEIGHDTGSYVVEVASEEAREHWELSEVKDASTWEIS